MNAFEDFNKTYWQQVEDAGKGEDPQEQGFTISLSFSSVMLPLSAAESAVAMTLKSHSGSNPPVWNDPNNFEYTWMHATLKTSPVCKAEGSKTKTVCVKGKLLVQDYSYCCTIDSVDVKSCIVEMQFNDGKWFVKMVALKAEWQGSLIEKEFSYTPNLTI